MAKKELKFEEQFKKLQEIVDLLDSSDESIEKLVEKYEEGMALLNNLRDFLNKAEMKVVDISKKYEKNNE